ncbi:MAG: type I secretion system permease/ATPase, partial [Pseudomonadota bacterium]
QALKATGTTVVVVAHRPSAIHAVDKILFIRDGRQLAFGPRDEILAKILKSPAGGPKQVGKANVAAAS